MSAYFQLQPSAGRHTFSLMASNYEPVLTGERHAEMHEAMNCIGAVKVNASIEARYERLAASDRRLYFVLKAANGDVLGTSELYSAPAVRDAAIQWVRENAPLAPVRD